MQMSAQTPNLYRLFIPQKPQDKKRLRAAASEAGEGGESSAAGVGRRKVHSRANKNRPQEVTFTHCAQVRKHAPNIHNMLMGCGGLQSAAAVVPGG